MPNHRSQLVGLVPNPTIVGESDPSAGTDRAEPVFVPRVRLEMVAVPLDGETCGSQDVGEAAAEITIGEEDTAQAVRSYSTACSISGRLRP